MRTTSVRWPAPVKIIEITNVDFSLRHFLLPLMRAIRARGHEVVGACAEGPLLTDVRAEGFRVIAIPFVRRLSPLAHIRAFQSLVAILRAEKIAAGNLAAGQGSEASAIPVAMARLYADKAMSTIELSARKVIAAIAEGDMLRTQLTILRRLSKHDSADTITLRRQVARHVIRAGKYSL